MRLFNSLFFLSHPIVHNETKLTLEDAFVKFYPPFLLFFFTPISCILWVLFEILLTVYLYRIDNRITKKKKKEKHIQTHTFFSQAYIRWLLYVIGEKTQLVWNSGLIFIVLITANERKQFSWTWRVSYPKSTEWSRWKFEHVFTIEPIM